MINKINEYFKKNNENKLNIMKASDIIRTKKIVNKVNSVFSKIDSTKKNILLSLYNSYKKEMDKQDKN